MLELVLNDISSAEFGLFLTERPDIPSPERDVEQIPVRGRNGSLTKKYGWKNIQIPVEMAFKSSELKPDLRQIKAWLYHANKLYFSDDEAYYLVDNVLVEPVENKFKRVGIINATFSCKPLQYAKMPKVALSAPGTIYNPGTENAEPYIKVTGSGLITLDIDGRDILLNLTDYVEIDTEKGYAHKGTAGADNLVSGDLPILTPGYNNISWTGTVQTVEIEYKAVFL